MRDFLYSDIAAINGMSNIPNDPDLAIEVGTRLCEDLLEPIQDAFGRIAIRSAYRSEEVNDFGNKNGHNCARNELNYAGHIWDRLDAHGLKGATACIVVPSFWERFQQPGDWQKLAWWIHDNLPHGGMTFFPIYWAFNLSWYEKPEKKIYSYIGNGGYLTKPGYENHGGDHRALWEGILP